MNSDGAHFVYATRSIIPSKAANAVQSANMACAFGDVYPDYSCLFRSPVAPDELPATFASYGLQPPRNASLIPFRPGLDWTQAYLGAFAARFLRQPRPCIVYTRSGRIAWTASLLGLDTVIELHDPLIPPYAAWLRRQVRARRSLKLVATTERLKNDLVAQIGIPEDHVCVAGGAVNPAVFELPALPLNAGFAFNAAYAGSAFKGKGLEIVIACAARLPDVGFHVIGPSADDCRRYGPVGPNVILHGRQDNRTTLRLLKSADCLLLPNQPSVIIRSGADIGSHTSPLKMFEYMASGRPIIASDLPVLTTALRNEHNALLCPATDPAAFCTALERLRLDPGLAGRLGGQARRDAETNHTWPARAAAIQRFIARA